MKTTHDRERAKGRDGGVLVAAMLILGLLAVLVGSLYQLQLPELVSAAYQRRERAAFYNAEAGVQYAMREINSGLQSGLINATDTVQSVNITAPAGYSFDPITSLSLLPNGRWMSFIVTGRYQNAKAVVEASVTRPRLMTDAGIFGDLDLRCQPNGEIYSYRSSEDPTPTAAESTGEANIGSNEGITLLPHLILDGVVLLGESPSGSSPAPPSGYEYEEVGRIDPDPLGALDGALSDAFIFYSDPANNKNTAAGIAGNRIDLGPNKTFTLPGGKYYLVELSLGARSTLNVTAPVTNPAVIFLNGPLTFQPNCDVNVTNGLPSNFFIFSKANSEIRMQPNGAFSGFVYAPFADIRLQPGGALRGVFWGKTVRLQPGNDVFIDVDLLDRFLSARVNMVQWRRIIEE